MEQLLERIFNDYFLLSAKPPTEEYRCQLNIVSSLQDEVAQILGQDFSETLWYAHTQLSSLELKDAFLFGVHLSRALFSD